MTSMHAAAVVNWLVSMLAPASMAWMVADWLQRGDDDVARTPGEEQVALVLVAVALASAMGSTMLLGMVP